MTSTIKKNSASFKDGGTKTFPFTADTDGILTILCIPTNSTSTAYLYLNRNGNAYARGASMQGLQFTLTIPIRKGETYSVGSSANVSYTAQLDEFN